MLAERQMLERAGDLVGFFHTCAHRAHAGQHHNLAWLNPALFDGSDCILLVDEHTGVSLSSVHAVGVDYRGVNGGALNH